MEIKNYAQIIKNLHKEITAKIAEVMNNANVSEVDLLGSDADHAFMIGYYNDDVVEMEVSKVYLNDGVLELDVIYVFPDDDGHDVSEEYKVINANDFTSIIPCAGIGDVLDSVRQVLNKSAEDRYVLLYDGEEDSNGFSTSNLDAAINAAIQDYEEGGYSTIEILDSSTNRIVWTTDD